MRRFCCFRFVLIHELYYSVLPNLDMFQMKSNGLTGFETKSSTGLLTILQYALPAQKYRYLLFIKKIKLYFWAGLQRTIHTILINVTFVIKQLKQKRGCATVFLWRFSLRQIFNLPASLFPLSHNYQIWRHYVKEVARY